MEVVSNFNKELKSIMESKLPVSRHKMSLITKSAMKALKFYKHVVQSVEKFIAKCSCDYKVPGLYVIDAIVRQSKHQYCDKDVFVPRFMRNIVTTFIYLSQCDPKDVTSIERVLRLWQQNGVFPTDLVEALLEIVYSSSDADKIVKASTIVTRLVNEWNVQKGKPEEKLETFLPPTDLMTTNDTEQNNEISINKMEGGLIDSITKLLTKFHAETGQDVSAEINQIQSLHQKIVQQSALLAQGQMIDAETLSQLHQSMEELTKKAAEAAAVQQSKLAMLDDKDNNETNNADMEFVEQLQQMVETLGQTRALQMELRQAIESRKNEDQLPTAGENSFVEDKDLRNIKVENEEGMSDNEQQLQSSENIGGSGDVDLRVLGNHNNGSGNHQFSDPTSENGSIKNEKAYRASSSDSHKQLRSDSGSRASKRKRSRSREGKKKEKKNRESRRKYQPILRSNQVGIMSHTVFIGHLNKHLSESKLRNVCEEFGDIQEFNMIPPRGCAFVTFMKRKAAYKAVSKLHEQKFEGRELKVAWAPNKGIKDDKDLRDNWVESEGCTYVPIDQFPINRSSELTEGGAEIDEDSLTEELKQAISQFEKQKADALAQGLGPSSVETMISVAAEVVNQTIPVSIENSVDMSSAQFFAHYPPPPPMIPQILYPPPPPHGFSIPPPQSHLIDPASSQIAYHNSKEQVKDENDDSEETELNNTTVSVSVSVSPALVSGGNAAVAHNHMIHPPPPPHAFMRPGMRNPIIIRGRLMRPPPLPYRPPPSAIRNFPPGFRPPPPTRGGTRHPLPRF